MCCSGRIWKGTTSSPKGIHLVTLLLQHADTQSTTPRSLYEMKAVPSNGETRRPSWPNARARASRSLSGSKVSSPPLLMGKRSNTCQKHAMLTSDFWVTTGPIHGTLETNLRSCLEKPSQRYLCKIITKMLLPCACPNGHAPHHRNAPVPVTTTTTLQWK